MMKFYIDEKRERAMSVKLEKDGNTVIVVIGGKNVIYLNDADKDGTMHTYKNYLKELGIKVHEHK